MWNECCFWRIVYSRVTLFDVLDGRFEFLIHFSRFSDTFSFSKPLKISFAMVKFILSSSSSHFNLVMSSHVEYLFSTRPAHAFRSFIKRLIWYWFVKSINKFRSSHSEVFLENGVLKICSKFTVEDPCRSAKSNFIEIAHRHECSPVNLLHIFRILFLKNTSEGLLLQVIAIILPGEYQRFCRLFSYWSWRISFRLFQHRAWRVAICQQLRNMFIKL